MPPFRGSEKPAQRSESNVSRVQRSGGRGPAYRGARGGGDARGGMAAYQAGVRNRQGTQRMTPGQQTQGVAFSARDTARRPMDRSGTNEAENDAFFSDVLQKRFGGDASVRDRLVGMYDKSDPMSAVNKFNEWSGNQGEVFNPTDAARAEAGVWKTVGGQTVFTDAQTAEEQAKALEQFNMIRGFI